MIEVQADPLEAPGYAVDTVVGHGATAVVWAATDLESGDRVALKVTPPQIRAVDVLDQASREISILELVDHEHVVRMRTAFALPDGSACVVLDLAEGGSLSDLVAARGRLTDGEAATILTPVAVAVDALHEAGVVHGDLSPGNVLFTADGRALLGDFEASRISGERHPPMVAGTPGFVAPEVEAGGVPDEASDAYALGALAWFALAGRAPDPDDPDPGRHARVMVGPAFAAVVARLLAPDPSDRPSASEAAIDFYRAAAAVPVRLVPGAADPTAALTRRMRARAGEEPSPKEVRRRPDRRHRTGARRGTGQHRRAQSRFGLSRFSASKLPVSRFPLSRIAVSLCAVSVIGVGALLWQHSRTNPTESAAPMTESAAPSATSATAADEQVRTDPGAVLAELGRGRAHALETLDATLLVAAEAPNSPMLSSDSGLVASLVAAGQRYSGLAFQVRQAQWLGGAADSAAISAVVDRQPFTVLGPGAQMRTMPAEPGRTLTYDLVRTPDGWRLASVRD